MADIQTDLKLSKLRSKLTAYTPTFVAQAAVDRVNRAFKTKTLTLVLGAGASSGLGFPQWNELVDDLYAEVYRTISPRLGIEAIKRLRKSGHTTNATMIRHLENLVSFKSSIRVMARDRLYRDYDERGARRLVKPICDLFLQSGARHRVNHVINYNFDNAVERNLRASKRFDVCSVYSAETYPLKAGGLRVYHPHGFLPHASDDPTGAGCDAGTVFSERDYNVQFMDANNWANVLQLHHYMNRTCLFIGISMTDPNMRRLLDHAHQHTQAGTRHVSIQKTYGSALADHYIESDLASLGVETLWVRDYTDIPRALKKCAAIR